MPILKINSNHIYLYPKDIAVGHIMRCKDTSTLIYKCTTYCDSRHMRYIDLVKHTVFEESEISSLKQWIDLGPLTLEN